MICKTKEQKKYLCEFVMFCYNTPLIISLNFNFLNVYLTSRHQSHIILKQYYFIGEYCVNFVHLYHENTHWSVPPPFRSGLCIWYDVHNLVMTLYIGVVILC